MLKEAEQKIRNISNFPKEGIEFKDITPLLKDAKAFHEVIDAFVQKFANAQIDYVVAIESRGYLLGAPLAYELGAGLVVVRKPGKLPAAVERVEYDLEYGTDVLEIHKDAIEAGKRVLIIDDLLATGGTVSATCELVQRLGGKIVSSAFLIELSALHGRDRLSSQTDVFSLFTY